ncbi:heat-inducible transcription repressor HrcA [bacterium]|nr:heat-inducible transcription repressor HrcA [candidate division CSSED10-310 bacterium]
MMNDVERLTEREKDILLAVLHQYILKGEPVGSRTISQLDKFDVSSATIRNVMGSLEERGYLLQPHTSAGRIPTDKAYRFLVNNLVASELLTENEKAAVREGIEARMLNRKELLVSATELLSSMTRFAGLVLSPHLAQWRLRRLELIALAIRKIMVVIVSDAGLVNNRIVEMEKHLDQEHLNRLSRFMNEHFVGLTMNEIRLRLLVMMSKDKLRYDQLMADAVAVGGRAFEDIPDSEVYIDGAVNLFVQADLKTEMTMQELYRAFTEKVMLVKILNRCLNEEDPAIYIGREKPELGDLSVVASKYYYKDRVMGTLGVIGPTRMPYPKVIALVDFTARTLSRIMSRDETILVDGSDIR